MRNNSERIDEILENGEVVPFPHLNKTVSDPMSYKKDKLKSYLINRFGNNEYVSNSVDDIFKICFYE